MISKDIALGLGIFAAFSCFILLCLGMIPKIEFWFGWTAGGKVSYVLLELTALIATFSLIKAQK